MRRAARPAAATSATGRRPRRCRPIWARSRSAPRATATAALSRSWWPRARRGWPGWMSGSSISTPAGSTRDISVHLAELYGVQVGRDRISRVTAAVMEDVKAWQGRPVERVYPIVYFDAMRVKRIGQQHRDHVIVDRRLGLGRPATGVLAQHPDRFI